MEKLDVGRPCRAHGADGATINAGTADPGEKPAVRAGVTRDARTITFRKIQRHHGATVPCRGDSSERRQGWSPVPASNAPTPSLSLAERKHLGRDAIRRLRLMQTQIVDVGAASLECTVNGSGDPLVVLANAGCSTGYLERFGERLPRSQIIAINMRGSEPAGGRSTTQLFMILPRTLAEFLRLSSAALRTSSVMPSVTGSPAAWPLTFLGRCAVSSWSRQAA